MKLRITGLLLFLAFGLFGQTVRTVGVVYTASAPVHTPSGQGAWIAVDTTSGSWYEWERTTGVWRDAGYRIQLTNTSGAPSYTPSKARGRVALNSGDSLYAYQAGAWACLNCVAAPDLSGYVEYSDSNTIYITPDQLSDSLSALPDSIMSGYGVAGYLPQYYSATKFDTTGLFWDATTGRLGIGIASSLLARLHSQGPGTTSATRSGLFTTSAGVTVLAIQDNGFVGIGPQPPARQFHISAVELPYNHMTNDESGHTLVDGLTIGIVPTVYGGPYAIINYREAAPLDFYTQNAFKMRLTATGRLGINQATPTARLHITGEGPTSSTTALLVENSAGTDIIKADNGGFVTIGAGANTSGAVLDVQSTTGVFAPPRMTTVQRDALTPPTGGIIFCTDCTATDGSTGVSQTYSSGAWKNHY